MVATAALLGLSTLGGCKGRGTTPSATSQPVVHAVEKTAERGPVKLTVRLNKDRVTIAEPFELTIEARAEPDVDVKMPQFGGEMQEFAIRDFRERSPRADEKEHVWRQTYTLDSFVSGHFELPGIEVGFTDRRPQSGATTTQPVKSTVKTEALALDVESLLSGKFDPQKFNDIKGPVSLPMPRSRKLMLWAGAVLALFALVAAAAWWRRRKARAATVAKMPPHQWALLELEKLVGEDLVGKGLVTEFYYRLNGLLRQYIELRFGLAAAEQTSEEFIRALQTDGRLPGAHKEPLRGFVEACDPVKYARYQPESKEIEQVFNAARDFILQTRGAERELELEEAAA